MECLTFQARRGSLFEGPGGSLNWCSSAKLHSRCLAICGVAAKHFVPHAVDKPNGHNHPGTTCHWFIELEDPTFYSGSLC